MADLHPTSGDQAPTQPTSGATAPSQQQPFSSKIGLRHPISLDKDGKPIRPFVSAGEHIHDEITYRGVDWLMNSAFGVAFSYVTLRTGWGRKIFTDPLAKGLNSTFSFLKSEAARDFAVTWSTRFITIMFGGTVTIPPLIALEKHENKKSISKFFDRMIYGKDRVENDPKFQRAYEEIDYEPKKGAFTGFAARILALAPLFWFSIDNRIHSKLEVVLYKPLENASRWIAKTARVKPKGHLLETMAEKGGKPQSNWDFLHETIAFDFGLTILYSFLHQFSYRIAAQTAQNFRNGPARPERHDVTLPSPSEPISISATPKKPEKPSAQISHIAREGHTVDHLNHAATMGA